MSATTQAQAPAPATSDRPVPRRALLAASLGVVGAGLALVIVHASLYADGAYYLLRLIQSRQSNDLPGREVVNAVRELPAMLGIWAGVDQLRELAWLQALGFIGLPVVAWCAAFYIARRSALLFGLVVLTCAVCFGNGILFSVSELTLTIPLVVLLTCLLFDADDWDTFRTATALGCTVILLGAYEFMVFWGVLLAAQAADRARRRSSVAAWVVAGLAVAGALRAAYTLAAHPNPNQGDFLASLTARDPGGMLAAVLAAAITLAVAFLWQSAATWARVVLAAVAGGAVLLFAVHALGLWREPGQAYLSRVWLTIMLGGFQALVLGLTVLRERGRPIRAPRALLPVSLGVLAVSLVSTVLFAVGWHGFLSNLGTSVNEHEGTVTPVEAVTSGQQRYFWGWPNGSISLLVREQPGRAVVTNPRGGWEPFAPEDADQQLGEHYRW